MTYYTPGPKTNLLVADLNMLIWLFGGHVTPYVRARTQAAEQFLLDGAQLSAIDKVSCPTRYYSPSFATQLEGSMSIYFSEQSGHRSGTYEVFNLHDNVLLASGLIHFPEKRTKGTVEIIRVVSGEAMYRPLLGSSLDFHPSSAVARSMAMLAKMQSKNSL